MTTLKLGWGTRIALLYGGFVLLIAALVIGSMNQHYDLVSADYYNQEIKYQNVIDAGKNQAKLSAATRFDVKENNVEVTFPDEISGKAIKGKIDFYSPVNASWDRSIEIDVTNGKMTFPRNVLRQTSYKAKISWEVEGKEYYQETTLQIK